MEETGTNIHTTLMRRNNFLRENPISGQNVAVGGGRTSGWPFYAAVPRYRSLLRISAMTEQEPGRRVSAYGLHW